MVDRLRSRFGIGRVCVVADRGMISAETLAELETRGIDYILGLRHDPKFSWVYNAEIISDRIA